MAALVDFAKRYLEISEDIAAMTKIEHDRSLRLLKEFFGKQKRIGKITPLDARRFVTWYRQREYRGRTPAAAMVNKVVRECQRIFRETVACSLVRENSFHGLRQEKVGERA